MAITKEAPPTIGKTTGTTLLRNLKIALVVLGSVFTIHAIPRHTLPEAFPLTRWAMFSGNRGFGPRTLENYEFRVTGTNGSSYVFDYNYVDHTSTGTLYEDSGVAVHHVIGYRMIEKALKSEDAAERTQYRGALVDRIEDYYKIEIATLELWLVRYEVDDTEFPWVDYDNPIERVLIEDFASDLIQAGTQ